MKKTVLTLLFALAALGCASCNHGATKSNPASTSGAATSSNPDTSSPLGSSTGSTSLPYSEEIKPFVEGLNAKVDYYVMTLSYTIRKDGTTYKNGYERKEINTTAQIEHTLKRSETIAGYEDNDTTVSAQEETFQNTEALYALGGDNKYHVSDLARTEWNPYHLSYDFGKGQDYELVYDGSDAVLSAKVASEALTAFGFTASPISDFAFLARLYKVNAEVQSFSFSYVMKGYNVLLSYTVDVLQPTLAMPVV